MRTSTSRDLALAAVVALGASACAPDLPAPELSAVDPEWGYNGDETDVTITGSGFYPRVQARGSSDFEVDRQFGGWLVGDQLYALGNVELLDYATLAATVPAGIDPGLYALRVDAPSGERAVLDDAFTVTDTRADHLSFIANSRRFEVGRYAILDVQLADPADEPVSNPLAIAVEVVEAEQGGTGVQFEDSLDGQAALDEGIGITGQLDESGYALVTVTSLVPDDLTLEVRPLDESSPVKAATENLIFTPGQVQMVQIDLPKPDFSTTVGEPFDITVTLLDAEGNVAEGVAAMLTLEERCGEADTRFHTEVSFVASTVVEDVVVTGATSNKGCEYNRLDASGVASSTVLFSGQSEAFDVDPGPPVGFKVRAWPDEIVAGEDLVSLLIEVVDEYGNLVTNYEESLVLTDSVGGLNPATGTGSFSCEGFSEGETFCQAELWTASAGVVITAEGGDGTTGESNAVDVLTGPPALLVVTDVPPEVEAGVEFSLELRATDRYSNPVIFDPTDTDDVHFDDGHGSVSCTWKSSTTPLGTEKFTCTATLAEEDKVIEASVGSLGLTGESDTFEVYNSDLDSVDVYLGGVTTIVAGASLAVDLLALDAYGNPYTVQAVSELELYDASGDVDGHVVILASNGTAAADLEFTTAIENNQIDAASGGTTLGTSATFDVEAGPVDSFDVSVPSTWVWVDEALPLTVTALDAYGNTVTSHTGAVTASSASGLGEDQEIDDFADGVAEYDFAFDQTGRQDVIEVSDGGSSGRSTAFDVVSGECASPPTADLEVNGDDEIVLCLNSTGSTASTTVDASGSTTGVVPLVAYHYDLGDGSWTRSTSSSRAATWSEAGGYVAQVLVVDGAACGDLATASVWVGENDGTPAGPVTVGIDDTSLVAGSSTSGSTTVDLLAYDCAGDPADLADLYLWADLGEVGSSTSTVSTTGQGLAVTLDSAGEATVQWSMAATRHDGTATLHAGTLDGAAYGSGEATVTGEWANPVVVALDPVGTTSATFESMELVFSEPMLTSSFNTSRVIVNSPVTGSAVAVTGFTFSEDDSVCTVEFQDSHEASAGAWTLALSSELRDAGGNRLDGRFRGSASSITLQFGAVTDSAQDISKCSVSASTFRPDGDDSGTGEELDEVDLDATAGATPSWWEFEVADTDGELVYFTRQAGTAATTTIAWDGRDIDGHIVANGKYLLTVAAADAYWNTGKSCTTTVKVDNLVHGPE